MQAAHKVWTMHRRYTGYAYIHIFRNITPGSRSPIAPSHQRATPTARPSARPTRPWWADRRTLFSDIITLQCPRLDTRKVDSAFECYTDSRVDRRLDHWLDGCWNAALRVCSSSRYWKIYWCIFFQHVTDFQVISFLYLYKHFLNINIIDKLVNTTLTGRIPAVLLSRKICSSRSQVTDILGLTSWLHVPNPLNKTNCPACNRVLPAVHMYARYYVRAWDFMFF